MESTRLQQLFGFLETMPDDAFVLFAIAKEYEGLGQRDKALIYYLKIKDTHPNYVGLYYHLGKLYEVLQDFPTAFQTYKTGITVAKEAGDQHAMQELAGAKLELGDDEDFEN
ncbi:MAG: tetratricopeptide repeat protein [Bacteroidota bacterium]